MGEDGLCNICAEHPRFYNCYADREEAGLGLCCEEAARLLLSGDKPLGFIVEEDEYDDVSGSKYQLLAILAEQTSSFDARIERCMKLANVKPVPGDAYEWAEFLLSLERLDEEWTNKLLLLQNMTFPEHMEGMRYERLLSYFIYRHMTEENVAEMLRFCLLAVYIIYVLDSAQGFDIEHTRLFSSEIEYSDENIELIMAKMATMS